MFYQIPTLTTDNEAVNKAFRTAYSDMVSNIIPFQAGLLKEPANVILAGMGYETPWTRDCAINVSNCCGLLFPDVAKNTLLAVLTEDETYGVRAGGEYWDAIIWVPGAWNYYRFTGDDAFLDTIYEVGKNSLRYFEDTEFDEALNLFRGAACYGDGIAAYPDIYAKCGESGIIHFTDKFPEYKAKKGVGLPLHALSTNCLYYRAYVIMEELSAMLHKDGAAAYGKKAAAMKESINRHFWNEEKGYYNYLVDDFGNSDCYEGLGESFVILFDVADEARKKSVVERLPRTPNGIACVWPPFRRYTDLGEGVYGRHSGTIWPPIEAYMAISALKCGNREVFENELKLMTDRAVRDGQFAEIYHPITGEMYGGVQERDQKGMDFSWKSELKQTWSATGYLRMILFHVAGIKIENGTLTAEPQLMCGIHRMELSGIVYGGAVYDIKICETDGGYDVRVDKTPLA